MPDAQLAHTLMLLALFIPSVRAAPPNFVVLFVDDMGANQVNVPIARSHGFYSYTGDGGQIVTPNVAKLAEEGMLFQTWYSGFQVCSPSRASFMTGRLPVRIGIGMPEDKHGGAPGSPNAGHCSLRLRLAAHTVITSGDG